MQKTSTAYQKEMSKTIRSRQYVRVKFGLVDVDAGIDSNFTADNQTYFSSFEKIADDKYMVNKTYATFEKDRIKLDGSQLIASEDNPIYQGYCSSVMSDTAGMFTVKPTITISFTKAHRTQGLSFTFDKSTGDYIKTMQIKTYNKGVIVDDVTARFDSDYGIATNTFEDFDKIVLIPLETNKPYRRARIQTVIFGIGFIFTNNDILSINKTTDIDPINRRLPVNQSSFTLQDLDLSYNIDNPTGIWDTMEQQLPIVREFGQHIGQGLTWEDVYSETWAEMELTNWATVHEGDYVEWVQLGEYILSGKPTTNKYEVKFVCQDLISYLTLEYHKGVYISQGKSFYDIAVELMEFSNLLPRTDEKKHYVFDDMLKTIKTTAPIPIKQVRELLQLIAHACNCVLFTDTDNIVHIEPINSEQDNFHLSFYDQLELPQGEKIPQLQGVVSTMYNYFVDSASSELSKQTILLNGRYSTIIKFEPATNISVTASTGTLRYTAYSSAVEVEIIGSGECEIVITGNKVLSSKGEVVAYTDNINGEMDIEDNPLVTSVSQAQAQAEYIKDYLLYRTTYNLQNVMGYPEVETMDLINIESQFTNKFHARVLRHELSYSGTVKSKFIVKGLIRK